MSERKALGRGLDALFGDKNEDVLSTVTGQNRHAAGNLLKSQKNMAIGNLRANPNQPRRIFDEDALTQLTVSIKEHGVLQPILVRPILGEAGQYEIIAGERRWRASQRAKLHEVPVIIQDFTDLEVLEIGLVENLQRSDLTPLEEAEGYQRLMDEFGHTQEKLAQAMGKSRSHIANTLRLLKLPQKVKDLVNSGDLSAGHARALLMANDPENMADMIVNSRMSVRDLEKQLSDQKKAKEKKTSAPKQSANPAVRDSNTAALERDLTNHIGLKVNINHQKSGQGQLIINYQNLDQLDQIIEALKS